MAIVVEDGTGLSGAETYISVAGADAYHSGRNNSAWTGTDAAKEGALRKAADYIDGRWRFKGSKLQASQALEWPRSGATDWSGNDVSGIPARLEKACAELAMRALTGELYSDLDRGGAVKSESVGPISVTYMDGAPSHKVYEIADRLLAPYTIAGLPPMAQWTAPAKEAGFAIGMNGDLTTTDAT